MAPDFGFTLLATDGAARLGEIATAHGLVRIAALSGLHTFMNWPHPILTDSDGFADVEKTNAGTRVAALTKASDFDDDQSIGFALKGVVIGQDDQGGDLSAPVVIADQAPAPSAKGSEGARIPKGAKNGLNALRLAVDEVGAVPSASNHIPPHVKTVTLDQWRGYAYRRGISTSDEPRARQNAFQRACESLQAANLIGIWEPHVWLA